MRKSLIAVVVASTCAAILVAVGPAGAGTGKPFPVEPTPYIDPAMRAMMLAQAPLSAAAARILRAIERADMTGYAGVGLDDSGIVVWWKGMLPGSVAQAIKAEGRTVTVTVRPAAHSRADLRRAAAGLDADLRANPHSPYFGVEIATDGSGIVVDVDVNAAADSVDTVPSRWAVPNHVPVSFKHGPRASFTGRLNDMAPYRGGGRIQNNDNNATCTAGFAVTNGAANYMLTAGHCGRPGGTWNNGNDTRFFGTGARENVGHDLLLISAPVGGYMWWDTVVGVNEFVKRVVGSNDAFPGEWVCTSGATSGGRCGFKVSNNFQLRLCGYNVYGRYECYSDLVTAEDRVGGSPAARGGDSGGPVFGLSGSAGVIGSYGVIAKGTITAYAPAARGTGSRVIFQDFVTAQRDFGIWVMKPGIRVSPGPG